MNVIGIRSRVGALTALALTVFGVPAGIASASVPASVGAVVPAAAPASASSLFSTANFGYSDTAQFFTVPAGVYQLQITGWGGSGGNGASGSGLYAAPGGLGGRVSLTASVSPGDTLAIQVGGRGGDASGHTAGSGGLSSGSGENGGPGGNTNLSFDSGTAGGGGGGGTAVNDITASSIPILTAGGGGGGGGGGELSGYNGGDGGDGGTATSGACDPTFGVGVFGSGLSGGVGGQCSQPGTGPAGLSGTGEAPGSGAGTGGGGGGGAIGGGGGSDGGSVGGGAGGGGAGTTSWSPTATSVTASNGVPGDGGVAVSWLTAPAAGVLHTVDFDQSGGFTVPAGVTQLQVTAAGGAGGPGGGVQDGVGLLAPAGGFGADVSALVPVLPHDQLDIELGGAGGPGTIASNSPNPFGGGAGGAGGDGQVGGGAGGVTIANGGQPGSENGTNYLGATGGGGGGATLVRDTSQGTVLVDAGGGGGGGGDAEGDTGANGGPGGNAGSPVATGNPGDGNGLYGSGRTIGGTSNGPGGTFSGVGTLNGQRSADNPVGNNSGTGGGGGGGVTGGQAGQGCIAGVPGDICSGSAGGGGGGGSTTTPNAQNVLAGNSLGGNGSVTISWIGPPLALTAPGTLTGYALSPFSAQLAATGGTTPYTWMVASGTLPAGLALSPSGRLSGTPAGAGTTTLTVRATDNERPAVSLTEPVTIMIAPDALQITTGTLPAGRAGQPYHQTLAAVLGHGALHWSISSGRLPAGLKLGTTTGAITGTPAAAVTSSFVVRVRDSSTPTPMTATAHLVLTVNPAIQPAVYVTQGGYSALTSYPLGGNGNVTPLTDLTGAATTLSSTTAVAIDPTTGVVYVASAGQPEIAEYPYNATGNTAPTAIIAGDNTGLAYPDAETLDAAGDLYVANYPAGTITAYAPGASGNAAPIVTIGGPNTALDGPSGLTFDGQGNLYVTNLASNTITEFAPGATGNAAPAAIIQGPDTGLDGPSAITLTPSGNLLVANTYSNSVAAYPTDTNGDTRPLRSISGPQTGLDFPDGIDVDTTGNVYVANEFAGLEEFPAAATGNVAPAAAITGPATGLSAPGQIAVAPPLVVRTDCLPAATVGRPYRAQLEASLGTTPYRWSIVHGWLPHGLKLDRNGLLHGTPHRTGTYTVTVEVHDASHPGMTARRTFHFHVVHPRRDSTR